MWFVCRAARQVRLGGVVCVWCCTAGDAWGCGLCCAAQQVMLGVWLVCRAICLVRLAITCACTLGGV